MSDSPIVVTFVIERLVVVLPADDVPLSEPGKNSFIGGYKEFGLDNHLVYVIREAEVLNAFRREIYKIIEESATSIYHSSVSMSLSIVRMSKLNKDTIPYYSGK